MAGRNPGVNRFAGGGDGGVRWRTLVRMAVLLLDVMDTLVHDPFHQMPAFFGLDMAGFLAAKHPTAWLDFERGRIDEATYFDRMFSDGRSFDREAFLAMLDARYRWIEGVEPLLVALRARGHALYALSNYPSWYQRIEARLGLSRYLEWRFVSCMTGVRKPDPRSYLGPAESLGLLPEECLFIDDRTKNCDAAKACGLDAIHFRWASQLEADLVQSIPQRAQHVYHPCLRPCYQCGVICEHQVR